MSGSLILLGLCHAYCDPSWTASVRITTDDSLNKTIRSNNWQMSDTAISGKKIPHSGYCDDLLGTFSLAPVDESARMPSYPDYESQKAEPCDQRTTELPIVLSSYTILSCNPRWSFSNETSDSPLYGRKKCFLNGLKWSP